MRLNIWLSVLENSEKWSQSPGTLSFETEQETVKVTYRCPCCGSAMQIIETFTTGQLPRAPPVFLAGT